MSCLFMAEGEFMLTVTGDWEVCHSTSGLDQALEKQRRNICGQKKRD